MGPTLTKKPSNCQILSECLEFTHRITYKVKLSKKGEGISKDVQAVLNDEHVCVGCCLAKKNNSVAYSRHNVGETAEQPGRQRDCKVFLILFQSQPS